MLAGADVWCETVNRLIVELREQAVGRQSAFGRDLFGVENVYWPFDNERDYRIDRSYQLAEDYFAKQREIARELARD